MKSFSSFDVACMESLLAQTMDATNRPTRIIRIIVISQDSSLYHFSNVKTAIWLQFMYYFERGIMVCKPPEKLLKSGDGVFFTID